MKIIPVDLDHFVFTKADRMAESIYASGVNKTRNREKEDVFLDCLIGLALEDAAAKKFALDFNKCPEDPMYPGTYDHDLVNPITNERYEVKQAKLSKSGKYGKTLVFHKSVFTIAKDPLRYFDWFIFGQTQHVEPAQRTAAVKIFAVIPRQAVVHYSQVTTFDENYYYFQDAIAQRDGYRCTVLFKN